MFDKTDYRRKLHRYNDARSSLMSSNLPDKTMRVAFHIIDFARGAHDFEWSFAMVEELARRVRVQPRTIRRHIKALEMLGVFTVDRSGAKQMDAMLRVRYGRGLLKTLKTRNRFNGYTLNYDHPIWNWGILSEEELATLKEVIKRGRNCVPS